MAKINLTIKDETMGGKITNEILLALESELTTVRDVIQARVFYEVEKYNDTLPDFFNGLVQPLNAEVTLNGYKIKERKQIDAEKQFYTACDAFQKNAFFILIDNKQAASLEEDVLFTKDSTISFVKLTPLVGG